MTNIEAITNNLTAKYPGLLEDDVTVVDYYFIDCAKNQEIPVKDFKDIKNYLLLHKIKDFAMVILFSNNTIGYRLHV